ncbi:MAG TPA: DNA polymerase III subunit delta [Acidimicrobiales bacterium]
MSTPAPKPAYLITGDDPSLVRRAVTDLVDELIGPAGDSLGVETFEDDYDPAQLVQAARTPSFLGGRRIVVGRGIGQLTADVLAPLIDYLADPEPDATIVLVHDAGGRLNAKLSKAAQTAGTKIETGVPHQARQADGWWRDHLAEGPVRLAPRAAQRLRAHLGDDAGRLPGLLDTLAATYGNDAKVSELELEPFLGQAGGVKPWDLTDAVDRGDTESALAALARLRGAGGMHPLQVLAILHNHVGRALRLQGSGAGNEKEAAQLLGLKGSTFPARKAMTTARRLGFDGCQRAIAALSIADLEVRGVRDYGGADATSGLAVELAVIRLSEI